ncbi:hypothetical protein, partial [Paratractidigestivibacter sp.]|uniref:hypothetical protein n=1 Tax=Paratractidigestivibacter sp. TaxID=2847316 RepID=UPI002ABD2F7D
MLQVDEGEAAAAEPVADEPAEGSAEPEPDPEPAEAGAHEEQQEAVLEETAAVASESSATLTDGWTAYENTCEYKIGDQGCLTLRPLGGAASAELDSLSFGHRTDFTSFKTEGAIAITGTGKFNGLSFAFTECSKLKTADLSGLVIDEAVDACGLFSDCSSLTSVKLPTTFK